MVGRYPSSMVDTTHTRGLSKLYIPLDHEGYPPCMVDIYHAW
jgi:hypothetical protein